MVKRCFVAACNSGRRNVERVSMFKVPENKAILEKWRNAIKRPDKILTSKHYVCERHFEKNFIFTHQKTITVDGIKKKVTRPRLKKEAVPTIFSDYDARTLLKENIECDFDEDEMSGDDATPENIEDLSMEKIPICYKCLLRDHVFNRAHQSMICAHG